MNNSGRLTLHEAQARLQYPQNHRFEDAMEAFNETLRRKQAERAADPAAEPDWRARYVVGWRG